ncbi:putative glycosyltransferase [Rubidibacter lacunae KORDI 51-2]|uniref:Putative glycosyltransferase n=1 Tax=Rubidibacter lacunae KORDI 51-2 TaxID=582515 RepID=U5D5A2_9CHRO|nr:glycosyltransferase [Rubidibacter lacunae]ERN39863.1 putative glycosyltransferase [Rubidibacter lacunae KORDI 51-2]
MFFSVVIPTYNRLPILQKCLLALEEQQYDTRLVDGYEVIVVDDGSTDATLAWLASAGLARVCVCEQNHRGPAAARNLGVESARGNEIIFIDSDLVVTEVFLQAHATALRDARRRWGDRVFTYGRVVNTNNFDQPTAEPYKLTDYSAAYFATGNVAIARHWLEASGGFDTRFQLYGWEDLELGVRLKQLGLRLVKCPQAVGYHWHPPFRVEQLPQLIDRERQRGRTGALFYQKHPTFAVRLMVQMTWVHRLLWGLLTFGGLLNERTLAPLLSWLCARGRSRLALEISRLFLNWYAVCHTYAAWAVLQQERRSD